MKKAKITSEKKSFNILSRLGFQSAEAWTVILGFVIITTSLAIVGAGNVLNILFPAGAFLVGLFLYLRFPALYIGFTWWLLFLTPFVRRYADYRSGFTEPSPILLAPYLVIIIIIPTFLRDLPKIYQQRSLGLSFVLSSVAVVYAACIAQVQNYPLTQIVIASLDWLTPILIGYYLFSNWHLYPKYRRNIQQTFLWGVLVTSTYGIYQYIVVPEWDRLWRIKTNFITVGIPEPFQLNIFSTMNSNGPFAMATMTGLLLLFNSKTPLRLPAAGLGLVAILLSNVRTSWGALILAILTYTGSLKLKLQMRLLITLLVLGVVVFPVIRMEPFVTKINERVETFSNLDEDGSGQARLELYQKVGYRSLMSVAGEGIAAHRQDSGFITMLLQLGWIGTIPYLTGMLQLFFNLFRHHKNVNDSFTNLARSVVLALFATLFMGTNMIELSGVILWSFLGIGIASNQYHQHTSRLEGADIR